MRWAKGEFEVRLTPQVGDGDAVEPGISRLLIDKRFRGDLEAASQGQMLAVGTAVEGSAGYVALEVVRGTLHGRKGSFALQHDGVMNRGEPALTILVVPDSGTEELVGLRGQMRIVVEEGQHRYEFEYGVGEEAG